VTGYRQYRAYSIRDDADMVRLSMWDARGGEYHMTIAWGNGGRVFREARAAALEALAEAMRLGMEPGEISVGE
jgi:hypothetical protein